MRHAGLESLRNNIQRRVASLQTAVRAGLQAATEATYERTLPVVPVDTGALLKSAEQTVEDVGTTDAVAALSYGGESAPYAGAVHEDARLAHGSVFNAKYAEQIKAGQTHARKETEAFQYLRTPLFELLNDGDLPRIVSEAARNAIS